MSDLINDYRFDYFLLLILAILPFSRTGIDGVWNKTDIDYPIHPFDRLVSSFYMENEFSLGHSNALTHHLENLDVLLFLGFADFLGVPHGLLQRVYLVTLLTLMGWGLYHLFANIPLDRNPRFARIGALTAGIFYQYNPAVVLRFVMGDAGYLETMAFLPFAFTFFYSGLRSVRTGDFNRAFRYAVKFGVLSIPVFSGHPPIAVILLAFFGFSFLLHLFLGGKSSVCRNIRFGFVAFGLSMAMNAWWILPRVYVLFFAGALSSLYRVAEFGLFPSSYPSYQSIWMSTTQLITPLQCFYIQMFYWKHIFAPDYWNIWVFGGAFMVLGTLLAVIAYSSLLVFERNKLLAGFALTTLFFTGLTMGSNCFVGESLFQLASRFELLLPLLQPNRYSLLSAFGFSYLLGAAVLGIARYLSCSRTNSHKRFPLFFAAVIIVMVLANSFPLLTGDLSGLLTPLRLPTYYEDAGEWLRSQPGNFRVLLLPDVRWLKRYSWGPVYDMAGIEENALMPSMVTSKVSMGPEPERSLLVKYFILNSIEHGLTADIIPLLNLANVKYILVNDDLIQPPSEGPRITFDTSDLKRTLENVQGVKYARNFGNLTFYENEMFEDNLIYGTDRLSLPPKEMSGPPWFGLETFYTDNLGAGSIPQVVAIFRPPLQNRLPSMPGVTYAEPSRESVLSATWDVQEIGDDWNISLGAFSIESINGDFELIGREYDTSGISKVETIPRMADGMISVFVRSIDVREPGSQARVLVRYLNESNCLGTKLHDGDGDGRWDEYMPLHVVNGLERETTPPYWMPFPNRNQSSVAVVTMFLSGEVVKSHIDLGADGSIDSEFMILDNNPREGGIALRAERMRAIAWDDIVIQKSLRRIEEDFPKVKIVSYEKLNPATYRVKVRSESPFVLALLAHYDSDWKVYFGDRSWLEMVFAKPLEEDLHFLANGYANAWYIDKTGEFYVTIFFQQQTWLYVGAILTAITLLICLGRLFLKWLRAHIERAWRK